MVEQEGFPYQIICTIVISNITQVVGSFLGPKEQRFSNWLTWPSIWDEVATSNNLFASFLRSSWWTTEIAFTVLVKFCKVTQWLSAISTLDSHWEHKQSWKFAGDSTKHIFLTTLLKVQIMHKNYKKPDKLAIKTKLTWEESQRVYIGSWKDMPFWLMDYSESCPCSIDLVTSPPIMQVVSHVVRLKTWHLKLKDV